MKKKTPKIQYGKSYRYTSNEQAIKDLTRKAKEQQKAMPVDRLGTPIPVQVQNLAAKWIGSRVLIRGEHPHTGKSGTVGRVEFARALAKWGFVVNLDDGSDCFVFSGAEWKAI